MDDARIGIKLIRMEYERKEGRMKEIKKEGKERNNDKGKVIPL
jgi:hypothetical protein